MSVLLKGVSREDISVKLDIEKGTLLIIEGLPYEFIGARDDFILDKIVKDVDDD